MDVERLLKRWAGPPALQFRRVTRPKSQPVHTELKPLAKWVASGPELFTAFDAIDAFPHAESGTTLKALFKLVEAGVLELA